MADTKISALTAAGGLTGTEVVPVVQTGATVRTTTQDVANLATAAINVVSNALSNELSVRAAAGASLDARVSILSDNYTSLVNRVSANSGVGGGGGSVTSNELSAALAVSAVSGATSVKGLQSVVNQLSNRTSVLSQGISVVSQALSVQAAALSVRIDTQSQAVSVLSQQVSLLSQAHSTLSQNVSTLSVNVQTVSNAASNALSVANAASNAASVVSAALVVTSNTLSDLISLHNVLSNRVSANSGVGGGGSVTSNELSAAVLVTAVSGATSVRGLQSVVNQLSNRTSVLSQALSIVSTAASNALSVANAASQAASVVSNALSNEISNRISHVNVVSQAVSVLSQQVSILSQIHSALSQQVSALSSQVSTVSVAVTSVDTRVNTVSNQVSVLSQQVSLLSQAHSVLSQNVSTLSVNVQTVSNAASNALSVANAASNAASNALSVGNAVSLRLDGASARTTAGTSVKGFQSVVNALSSRISQVAGGFVASARTTAGTSVQGSQSVIDALSARISQAGGGAGSVTSTELSVKAPWTGATYEITSGTQSLQTSALANLSGLFVQVGANETWKIEGMVLISTTAAAAGLRMGFSVPPLSTPRFCYFAGPQGAGLQSAPEAVGGGVLQVSGFSVMYSVTSTTPAGTPKPIIFNAILNTTSSGTVRLMAAGIASVTASPLHILEGSYMMGYRLL